MQTKVVHVDPKSLKLLEVNARFMRHEEFQRLVANIKQDGQLMQVYLPEKETVEEDEVG